MVFIEHAIILIIDCGTALTIFCSSLSQFKGNLVRCREQATTAACGPKREPLNYQLHYFSLGVQLKT